MNLLKLHKISILLVIIGVVFMSSPIFAQDGSAGKPTTRSIFTTYTPPKKSVKKTSRVVVRKEKTVTTAAKKVAPKISSPVVAKSKQKVTTHKNNSVKMSVVPAVAKKIGKPGALIKIESVNGDESLFSPIDTIFKNKDQFRIHFQVNFPAYIALVNRGSGGSLQLLFPCKNESSFIQPTDSFQIPKGSNTFSFSGDAGEENLTFLMSRKPITIIEKITDVCANNLSNDQQTAMRSVMTNADSHSKTIKMSNDKDESDNLASYYFAEERVLQNTVSIKIKLVHQ